VVFMAGMFKLDIMARSSPFREWGFECPTP